MNKSSYFLVSLLAVFIFTGELWGQTITFTGEELLGKPTNNSITVNIVPGSAIEYYYEYGTSPGVYSASTSHYTASGGQPHEIVINGLAPNTRYYYRMQYSANGTSWITRAEHSFMTQRAPGSSFVFDVISDSHATFNTAHQQAMTNVRNDQPDFLFDLGDTFYPSNANSQSVVDNAYLAYREPLYMDAIGHSVPIYLAAGNHEDEEGWNLDDTPFSRALGSILARKKFFPTPVTDGFYTGNTDPLAAIDEAVYGDELREDYYAFEWGDALFVVIDEFLYTMQNPYGSTAGEGSDDPASGDQWNWTLGLQQYNWLKETLENSDSRYKFVFSHHVTGGIPRDISVNPAGYVRGGAEAATYFEWGGKNADGSEGFASHRPGWGVDAQHPNGTPIHQLFVENGVSAYFHGHDHQFVYEIRDGIVYQEVPSPSMSGSGFSGIYTVGTYDEYQTVSILSNAGHLRVSLDVDEATVEYVRSSQTGVSYTYTIQPNTPAITHNLNISTVPAEGGSTDPSSGTHSYNEGTIVSISSVPVTGYVFDHWEGNVTNTTSAVTTVTLDADQTVVAYFTAVPTHVLTLEIDPEGSGTTNPSIGSHTYNEGTNVTITAIPAAGYAFDHWTGNVDNVTSATTTVTLSEDQLVTAFYVPLPTYTLAMAIDPPGSGTTNPAEGIHSYINGSLVTITATPAPGYVFDHWGSDVANPTASTTTVTMDDHQNVTAYFVEAAENTINYIGDIGSNSIKNSSDSVLVITTTGSVNAGNDIIIAYATDPTQDLRIIISDAAGNLYKQAAMSISSGNLRTYIFASYDVNAMPAGSAIRITQRVITSTAVTARAAVVCLFNGLANSGALEQTCVASGTASTSPSSGAATTVTADQLIIGAIGTEGPVGDAAGTWSNSFTAGLRTGTTGGTAADNITISLGWRIVSAAGSYTAAKTGITSSDYAAAIASFKTTDAGISYIGDAGSAQTKAGAGTSLIITTNTSIIAGDDIILTFAMDGSSGTVSVSDGSNTYSQVTNSQFSTPGNTNVRSMVFAAYNVNELPGGSQITINHPSVTARAAVVSVFRGLENAAIVDQTRTATGTSNAVTTGATGTTSQENELLIGAVGLEGPNYDAPSVWQNSFTYGPRMGTNYSSGSGGGDGDVTTQLGWKIVGSTGAYTAQLVNLNTTRDWAASIATFRGGFIFNTQQYNILLSRPTNNSITVSSIIEQSGQLYIEYGTSSGNYNSGQTVPVAVTANIPVETVIEGLNPDTRYFYRLVFMLSGSSEWMPGGEYSFYTQRAEGETFTFTITSDSHLGETFSGNSPARYNQTTLNVAADHSDFHVDLGDAFMVEDISNQSDANGIYAAQRPYFGNFSHSSPVFIALGNHENEEGWNMDDTPFSKAIAGIIARKQYFPNPVSDGFYSGNNDLLPAIGSDQYREDYYAFEWGDALFVVLDPFQYTMNIPYSNVTGSGEDNDETVSGDQWNWTLGQEQYNWLKETLENSDANFKFVFSHHVVGGQLTVSNSSAGPPTYVRGGAMAADYFEWGGNNSNGTPGYSTNRLGWSNGSIHRMLVDYGVSAFFHGHDHQFVHEEIDGITYQLVPSAGMSGYGFDLYDSSPYAISGGNLPDPGHVRVTVSGSETLVEYVQMVEGGGTGNGQVAYSYTIESTNAPNIIISGTPLNNFTSEPGVPSNIQNYTVSGNSLTDDILITAPADFEISLTNGSGFGSSINLIPVGGAIVSTTIYVRFNRATDGTSTGTITHVSNGASPRNVALTGTATAPVLPDLNIILGRPTDHSVLANIISDTDGEISLEYGINSGNPGSYELETTPVPCTDGMPVEILMDGLTVNSQYYYRPRFRQASGSPWLSGEEASFRTQRSSGESFAFTIISDSHLGQYGGQTADERALYQRTIDNIKQDQPDFHIDLGDTYAMDPSPLGTGMTVAEADAAYFVQRPYLGQFCNSVPYFFVLGNHENEEGWNFDDVFTAPDQSLAVVGMTARKKYYPNPIPDGFYTGNTDPLPQPIGGDSNREDYYAWTWGDALFVVIDPFHYSMTWPSEGDSYGGEGQDGEEGGDRWDWSLGIEQYLWLKSTLENSDAEYKFVFSHLVTGGNSPYGRGGIEAAPFFEWGGRNADGTWGFDTERPAAEGWDLPIHQLMVANGVDVYFHGHDHIFAHEELDGIVYLECPKPDDAGYDWEPYGYGYIEDHYPDGIMIQNSGHIRVNVTPEETTIDYVRAYLPGDGTNGVIAFSDTVKGEPAVISSITVTSPNGGESWQAGSVHDITWTSVNTSGNVRIDYSANNGTNWISIIESTTDDGLFNWTIPNDLSSTCLVRISDTDENPADQSNSVFAITPETGRQYIPVWTGNGNNHMNFYTKTAKIDGVDMQPGDEIGIFDDELCVGAGLLTEVLADTNVLEIRVSHDDEFTAQIDGYTVNNKAEFRLWDASEQKEYTNTHLIFDSGNDTFAIGASCWYHIGGLTRTDQDIPLLEGWNVFSLNVDPDDTSMLQLVQPLIDDGNLMKVQDEGGYALECMPDSVTWINLIGNWRNTEGYKIRVENSDTLHVSGIPFTDPVNIDLFSGWNIISYPARYSQDATDLLTDLMNSGNLIKIQDEEGASIELIPETTTWLDLIGNFDPGEGYKVRVSSDVVLTIDPSGTQTMNTLKSTARLNKSYNHFKPVWLGNGLDQMNIYMIEPDERSSFLEPGDEIGIFDGALCVGASVIGNSNEKIHSLIVSADDPVTSEIDGFTKGHEIEFRIWRPSADREFIPDNIEFSSAGSKVFEPLGTALIKIPASVTDIYLGSMDQTKLGDIYPNPFNNSTMIPFVLGYESDIDISIYNLLGKKVITLAHGTMAAGNYSVIWDGAGLQKDGNKSGLYFCKMIAGKKVFVKMIEIVKE